MSEPACADGARLERATAQLPLCVVRSNRARVRSADAGGLTFASVQLFEGGHLGLAAMRAPSHLVFYCQEGATELWAGNGQISVSSGELASLPIHGTVELTARLGTRGALLLVPSNVLLRRLRESCRRKPSPAYPLRPLLIGRDTDPLAANLIGDCMARAAGDLEHGGRAQQIERIGELLTTLLIEALSESLCAPELRQDEDVPWYVTLVENYIAERVDRPISMKDLSLAAGVSPRTLHDGFRKHRGYSPMRYLRDQRMMAIRRELMSPEAVTTVTDSALKWGFNHLGRFSTYYARHFGERPSETLRVARIRSRPAARLAHAS